MNSAFSQVLAAAVGPIVLISGAGLLLLSVVNRYSTAISRIRELAAERRTGDPARAGTLSRQIDIIIQRCRLLRLSIGSIVVSVILSSLIVLGSVITVVENYNLTVLLTVFLLLDCLSIVIANILLLLDITSSLKAIHIEIDYGE